MSLSEISNFLTDVECDHLISYAKRLGLEKSPLAKAETVIDDETSQRTFKIWDNNDDGFIEPVEVRLNTTVTVREVSRIYRKWIIRPERWLYAPFGKISGWPIITYHPLFLVQKHKGGTYFLGPPWPCLLEVHSRIRFPLRDGNLITFNQYSFAVNDSLS